MLSVVITLLIGAVILAIVLWIIDLLPRIPDTVKQFIRIIVLIIFAIWLIGLLVGAIPAPQYPYLR